MRVNRIGGSRIKRGTQDKKLAVGNIGQKAVETIENHVTFGVQEFVDRRADRHDDRAGLRYRIRRVREDQLVIPERLGKQIFRAVLDERKASCLQRSNIVQVQIVDVDRQALARKG